jgi:hypothetical protein
MVLHLLAGVASCQREKQTPVRPRRATESESSRTIRIKPGDNLQTAVNNAKFGDVIVLEAGATYSGPLMLPDKGPGTGTDKDYITIQTSDLAGIAAEGERIDPTLHSKSMPKIVSPNNQVAVGTAPQAHHYKFIGIEFQPAANADYVYNVIDLGASDYKTLSQFPHHLIFDRCYVHTTGLNKARRGFALNSGETWVINSYVSGFAGAGDETQAVAGWNGPGPFHIINNFLQAGGEVVFFGGTDPSIQGLVPSDIEIRRNYLHRPAEWAGRATIKGTFELKNARKVVVDGNVLESEILATAFVITTRNQYGKAPWSTIEDVEITNNIVRHASTGINFMGTDNEHSSQTAKRIRIANNLFLDIIPDDPHNIAYFIQVNGGESVTVEHNTVQQDGNMINSFNLPTRDFVFRDNIIQFNLYGIMCFLKGDLCNVENQFCACFPNGSIKGNVIADNTGAVAREGLSNKYPRGNFFALTFDRIGFVDHAGDNWRLAPTSKYRGKATDGTDPGVNMDQLMAAGAGNAKTGRSR